MSAGTEQRLRRRARCLLGRRNLSSGRRRRRWGRRVLRCVRRRGCGRCLRVARDLTCGVGRGHADDRLAQPALGRRTRPQMKRLGVRRRERLGRLRRRAWRRLRHAWLRRARRCDADHRAAESALGRRFRRRCCRRRSGRSGHGKADDGLIEAEQSLATTRASRRVGGILCSAMRAQPHCSHYTPGPIRAKSPGRADRLQGVCPIPARSPMGEETRVPCSPNASSPASTFATAASSKVLISWVFGTPEIRWNVLAATTPRAPTRSLFSTLPHQSRAVARCSTWSNGPPTWSLRLSRSGAE